MSTSEYLVYMCTNLSSTFSARRADRKNICITASKQGTLQRQIVSDLYFLTCASRGQRSKVINGKTGFASELKHGAIDSVARRKLMAATTDGDAALRTAGLLCGTAAVANEVCMAVGAPHHVTARAVVAPST